MDYHVLEINLDPLPDYMEDDSPQAIARWIRDLPVFQDIPLKIRITSQKKSRVSEVLIKKQSENLFTIYDEYKKDPFQLDISTVDENGGRSTISAISTYQITDTDKNRMNTLVEIIAIFMEYADRTRQYPFEVIHDDTKKKGRRKKKKEQQKEKATIVYLNRPPQGIRNTGDGDPVEFGYPRRSHRRTLTDPRFKNHPKYGIYKGVRVKQCWCGPKTFQDRRRIYRLIEIQDMVEER